MSHWVRELFGWVLAAVGLGLIFYVVVLARNRMILEALAISFPASVVFRASPAAPASPSRRMTGSNL